MKKIFLTILSFCAINVFAQDLPTADAVIEKYFTAIGGKDAVSKIQDLTVSSTSESQRGTMETEIKFKFPDKFITTIFMNGNEINGSTYDGTKMKTSGFRGMGGGGGQTPPPPVEGSEAKSRAIKQMYFAEMFYTSYGVASKVVGKEKVGEKEAYKLELTASNGSKWFDYYDVESGLKVKSWSENETPRGKFESIVSFTDYKKFKGMEILIPAKTTRSAGQMGDITSQVQSLKVNKGLKDSDFVVKVD